MNKSRRTTKNGDVIKDLKEFWQEKKEWMKATHPPEKIKSLFKLKPEELELIKSSDKYGKIRYYPEDVFEYIKNRIIKSQSKLRI